MHSSLLASIRFVIIFFFFNDTATTEIYTLSLHERSSDLQKGMGEIYGGPPPAFIDLPSAAPRRPPARAGRPIRSEEHTSELQSLAYLVCRLLLEKKKQRLLPANCQYRYRPSQVVRPVSTP